MKTIYLMGCLDHRHAVIAGRTMEEAQLGLLEADAMGIKPVECKWEIIELFLREGDAGLVAEAVRNDG